jgi:hypothetical protein
VVGLPAVTTLLHCRIHIGHQTNTRPGKRGSRRLEPPSSAAQRSPLGQGTSPALAAEDWHHPSNPFWPPSPMRNRSAFRRWPLLNDPARKWRR